MNLYRVTCRGMTSGFTRAVIHGVAYAIAEDAESAYLLVRARLDKEDIGQYSDRALKCVELLAEQSNYPSIGHHLYISKKAAP